MLPPLPLEVPRAPMQPEQDATIITLDDDLLTVIFRHLEDVASLIRCLQVCKRFYHVISSILRTAPFFLGFYHVPNSTSPRLRRLPQYIHTEPHFTNPNLNLAYLNSVRSDVYSILESRFGQVLLRKMVHGPHLHFVLASPFRQSSETIKPLPPRLFDARIHRLIVCSYVPWTLHPNEGYKVIVVFSDRQSGAQFTVMGFSSLTHSWTSVSHNQNGSITFPKRAGYQEGLEPTVFSARMLYKLQNTDYILAVDPSTLLLSKIDLPLSDHSLLCYGNHCLGRTEEDNLCFFMMRKMDLFTWVYRINNNVGEWFLHEIVDINELMDPHAMGEVASMRFSANMLDQLNGFRLVTLNGFGEGSGILILVMADWVISYKIKSKRLDRLWYSHDKNSRMQGVYANEMVWPPVPMLPLGGQQGA